MQSKFWDVEIPLSDRLVKEVLPYLWVQEKDCDGNDELFDNTILPMDQFLLNAINCAQIQKGERTFISDVDVVAAVGFREINFGVGTDRIFSASFYFLDDGFHIAKKMFGDCREAFYGVWLQRIVKEYIDLLPRKPVRSPGFHPHDPMKSSYLAHLTFE